MQPITLNLSPEFINVVLNHLDAGSHREVRRVIDDIITQVNAQQKPAVAPTEPSDQPGLRD